MPSHLSLAVLPPESNTQARPTAPFVPQYRAPELPPPPAAPVVPAPVESSTESAACFDFDDLKALRDEYEERMRRMEREHQAQLDVLKKVHESQLTTLVRDHAQRVATEAEARQELIHELTHEIANAREDGEVRVRAAEQRSALLEEELCTALRQIERVEAQMNITRAAVEHDVNALKAVVLRALNAGQPAVVSEPQIVESTTLAQASALPTLSGERTNPPRRKIRLR
jgi:hypothetical protein